jgi:hypothetical protein
MGRSAVPCRDEHIPFAYLTTTPKSKSATSIFRAKSDKEGVHFEYKVYMIDLFTDVSLVIRALGFVQWAWGAVLAVQYGRVAKRRHVRLKSMLT